MSNVEEAGLAGNGDEKLRKATVGDRKLHNDTISLVDHTPEWSRLFQREADRVKAALGDVALRAEHVGSTAVPGMPAKPIIDMVPVVRNSSDEESYVPALEAAGYVLQIREPDWCEHRLSKSPHTDINLHVLSEGEPEIDRMLVSATSCGPTMMAANSTRRPSANWHSRFGGTCRRTTPTPGPR